MASTGTLINRFGANSLDYGFYRRSRGITPCRVLMRQLQTFFFPFIFSFFYDEWVGDLYASYRMRFKWLHVYVCLWSTLFRTGWKVERLECGVSFCSLLSAGSVHLSHPLSRWSRLDRLSPRELWPEGRGGKNTELGTEKWKGHTHGMLDGVWSHEWNQGRVAILSVLASAFTWWCQLTGG